MNECGGTSAEQGFPLISYRIRLYRQIGLMHIGRRRDGRRSIMLREAMLVVGVGLVAG